MPKKQLNTKASDKTADRLRAEIKGQDEIIEAIIPYLTMYQAGLNPYRRPLGTFMMLGPTGVGKTHTVHTLANVLHGSPNAVLRIDCGELQLEHEISRLVGAPPGYIGHRETKPLLTQSALSAVTSNDCAISIILLDEVEKAHPALARILLGVLDRGQLTLGDSNKVNFERSMVFMTSNLGASQMAAATAPGYGFCESRDNRPTTAQQIKDIGTRELRRYFSPEFVNRIDEVTVFNTLSSTAVKEILNRQIRAAQDLIIERLGNRSFILQVGDKLKARMLEEGVSPEYGARELKRVINTMLMKPLAELVVSSNVSPQSVVVADYRRGGTVFEVFESTMRSVA